MKWNKHFVKADHAFLGASKWHWINYNEEKLEQAYYNFQAAQEGTRLHLYAKQAIELGIKQKATKATLNTYINDAIGFRMSPEVLLYYSDNCFGTADAISFRQNKLRIHDLKTGKIPAHMEQLMIYAALFCLEYDVKPGEIEIVLRIYQNDEIVECVPSVDDISRIMVKIITFDKYLNKIQMMED